MIADTGKLKVTLPSDREIQLTYEIDAPRELVWKVMNDPALVSRWWGPRRYETIVEQMDFRPGGKFAFINKGQGTSFRFFGEYREIVAPEKVVQTMRFEGDDGVSGDMGVSTVTLTERDGRTTITDHSLFPSKEERDSALRSGMEDGARETYERLAELVAEVKRTRV